MEKHYSLSHNTKFNPTSDIIVIQIWSNPCYIQSVVFSPFQSESKTRLTFREDDLFPIHWLTWFNLLMSLSLILSQFSAVSLSLSLCFDIHSVFFLFRTNNSQKQRIWPGLRQRHHRFLLLKLQEYLKSLVLFWFITIIRSSLQLGKILPWKVVSCQHKENSWGNVSGSMVWRRSIYGSHQ